MKKYKVDKDLISKIINEIEASDKKVVKVGGPMGYGYSHPKITKRNPPDRNLGRSIIDYASEAERDEDEQLDAKNRKKVKVSKVLRLKDEVINDLTEIIKGYIDSDKLH